MSRMILILCGALLVIVVLYAVQRSERSLPATGSQAETAVAPAPGPAAQTEPAAALSPEDPAFDPMKTADPVASSLAVIACENAAAEKRFEAIHKLDNALDPDVVAGLWKIVRGPGDINIRNDVFLKLLALDPPVPVIEYAMSVITDTSVRAGGEADGWRGYMIQFADRIYGRETDGTEILKELEAIVRQGGHHAQTALLSLERIAEKDDKAKPILKKLASLALAEHKADPERMVTALQIAADTGDKNAVPQARKLAGSNATAPRLRMSALHVLAKWSEDKGDIEIIRSAMKAKDSRVRRAAALNLKKIEKRFSNG